MYENIMNENITLEDIKISTCFSGIKKSKNNEHDLLLVEFEKEASIAGLFTKSLTSSASVNQCKECLHSEEKQTIRAIVVNSGNANAFTGEKGEETVLKIRTFISKKLACKLNQVYTASTGVIGEQLDPNRVINNLKKLSPYNFPNWLAAANAIKTTDTFPKIAKRTCKIDNTNIEIVGIAKGSGMIAPNMATMLGFIFTNANLPSEILQKILKTENEKSFNSITVDSDTSTSDTLLLAATRTAKHLPINKYSDQRLKDFKKNISSLMLELAKLIVIDGEGASKFITIEVKNAYSQKSAKKIAFSIANSPLVKTAIAGEDANWGRIIMAIGKSGEKADRDKIKIYIGDELVTTQGTVDKNYSEKRATEHLQKKDIFLTVDLGVGKSKATVYTCDLTHKYIEINADYRS
ncbi:MAG: bifunctional glutamate N-acetyltransferase/amino-acid acetyltransferase ArgJ [Alphaproteobacteria bacterium]|nr:bifunctional glutamate N-acetyltransferase/amino-acid acetyltransferase ArgJ [Alphaproteobacteria bacterium]MBL6851645.1 bifunctional glutamate N-acetyltransferase/amino-acid acetyltransferase ArgJ [Alphaproteobacteria bacterium]